MFSHLKSLYLRFKAQHFELTVLGFPIKTKGGRLIGNVDQVILTDHKIAFQGWCQADRVTLMTNGGGTASATPSALRTDVSEVYGGSPNVGFHLAEAFGNGRYTLTFERSQNDVAPLHIRPVTRLRRQLAFAAFKLSFLKVVLLAFPDVMRWKLRQDYAARLRAKKRFRLTPDADGHRLDKSLLCKGKIPSTPAPLVEKITIILPVFNAFDLLPEVLARVVTNTDVPWRLLLIEDCSTDPDVRPWLRQWVAHQKLAVKGQIELLENEENLGFIRSVNRGLQCAIAFGDHVVLLNSDAFVPKCWAGRLLAPICADASVASTTPMSNDAEIFSVPGMCQATTLQSGQGEALDKVALRIPAPPGTVEVPTGVGFCMAMNIAFLKKIPKLDTVFGRGYGEEVDWCQKVRAIGGRHVAVPNLFVEHRGGTSFGCLEKQALIAKHNSIIATRHPNFDLDVQRFVKSDPLITPRMILAVAWAAGQAGERLLPIYLAHSLGGGADLYLERRMQKDWKVNAVPSIVLRVGGTSRLQVEVVCGETRCKAALDAFSDLEHLLAPVKRRRITYSCGVGDCDPISLPEHLVSLKSSRKCQIELLVHDYFMVSPAYTLLNEDGVFTGPIDAARDPHRGDKSLFRWQQSWRGLIAEADRLIVFSQSSRDLILATYPAARRKVLLCPHDLLVDVSKLPAALTQQKRVVAVLGNIGFHKGAEVLCELGPLLAEQKDISLMVLGEVDPMYKLPKNIYVYGTYDPKSLGDLARWYQITDWLIPSIWPETFSYTTHEALATGLPTYAFDIGAQGDAVARRKNGHAVPYNAGKNLAQMVAKTLLKTAKNAGEIRLQQVSGL